MRIIYSSLDFERYKTNGKIEARDSITKEVSKTSRSVRL